MSAIKEMAMRSARVPGAASLTWGLPSFTTPRHVREAAARALSEDPDVGKYALPDGLPAMRALAARHYRDTTGIEVDPDANVVITAGNMEGLNALFHVILDAGDRVIVTDPGFASHFHQIRLCDDPLLQHMLADTEPDQRRHESRPERISPGKSEPHLESSLYGYLLCA